MATDDEKQSFLKKLTTDTIQSLDSMPDFQSIIQGDDLQRTRKRVRNFKEIGRRVAKSKKLGDNDIDAKIKTVHDVALFLENTDVELPRAFDADELEEKLYVEPVPIINPPKDWASKKHIRWHYSKLPTSTSIRLLKLQLLDDYEPWEGEEERGPESHSLLHCSIEVVDLADDPDFFALSYTWGDPRTIYTNKSDILPQEAWHAPSFEIICDGKTVTVTANLYNALITLRASWSNDDYILQWSEPYVPQINASQVYIWVDQLCINQDDVMERNLQVPMMESIYRQAKATIMWLGGGERLASAGTKNALIGLQSVIQKFREMLDDHDGDNASIATSNIWRNSKVVQDACSTFDLRNKESYTALGLEPVEPEELIGWYLMYSRSWFNRAWTVQEWALSKACVFVCGALSFHAHLMLEFMDHFFISGWLYQIENLVRDNILDPATDGIPSWNKTPEISHRVYDGPRWGGGPRETMPALYRPAWADLDPASRRSYIFSDIKVIRLTMGSDGTIYKLSAQQRRQIRNYFAISLESFRPTQATDPRDKVFAFYSLFKDDDGAPVYSSPDYNKTVRQVYIEATLTMAKEFGPRFLGFLGSNDYSSNEHDLPSWVADLSQTTSGALQLQSSGREQHSADAGLSNASYMALLDGDIFQLSGCHIDTVSEVQEDPLGACNLVYGFRELHHILCRLPELSEISTSDGEIKAQNRYEVYWRTKIRDCAKDGSYPAPIELGQVHLRRLERFLIGQITHAAVRVVKQNIDQVLEEANGSSSLDSFLSEFLENLASPQSKDHTIKAQCEAFMKAKYFQMNSDEEFDMERHGQAITVINTYLSMLKGEISFHDFEGVISHTWTECEEAFENLARARQSRDYTRFRDSLWYLLFEMGPNLIDMDQAIRDKLRGEFRDNDYFFATNGGRLGQNPGGAEVGDEIWILAGLHAPIILRRVDEDRHRVVGCAYVHGVMHGEGVVGGVIQKVHLI